MRSFLFILAVGACISSVCLSACDSGAAEECTEQIYFRLYDADGGLNPAGARFCFELADVLYGECEYNIWKLPGEGAYFKVQRLQVETCPQSLEGQYGDPAQPILLAGTTQIPDLNGDRRFGSGTWKHLNAAGGVIEDGRFDFYTKLYFPPGLELPPLQTF